VAQKNEKVSIQSQQKQGPIKNQNKQKVFTPPKLTIGFGGEVPLLTRRRTRPS